MRFQRVLVIDDDDDIREVAMMSLETTENWEVAGASSGVEGIAMAETFQPTVILLDVMMPGMDGPTTLKALQNSTATHEIPVMFMTAKVQPADKQKYLELGVRGVITKPFDPMTLGAYVVETLGRRVDPRNLSACVVGNSSKVEAGTATS